MAKEGLRQQGWLWRVENDLSLKVYNEEHSRKNILEKE